VELFVTKECEMIVEGTSETMNVIREDDDAIEVS
jgi:hypothetical protein